MYVCDASLVHKNDKEADKQERKLLINSCKTVADNGVSCPYFATNRTDLPTLIFFWFCSKKLTLMCIAQVYFSPSSFLKMRLGKEVESSRPYRMLHEKFYHCICYERLFAGF